MTGWLGAQIIWRLTYSPVWRLMWWALSWGFPPVHLHRGSSCSYLHFLITWCLCSKSRCPKWTRQKSWITSYELVLEVTWLHGGQSCKTPTFEGREHRIPPVNGIVTSSRSSIVQVCEMGNFGGDLWKIQSVITTISVLWIRVFAIWLIYFSWPRRVELAYWSMIYPILKVGSLLL